MKTLVDSGALQMVINALGRDFLNGSNVRGEILEELKAKSQTVEPIFWYRKRSDGGIEGPIHHSNIEEVRKQSGGWIPLYGPV